jgi:hypothetical protein
MHHGVSPFVLLDGLLGREKAMDQTTSLRRGEFFVPPLAATSGVTGAETKPYWSQRGMDATMAARSLVSRGTTARSR